MNENTDTILGNESAQPHDNIKCERISVIGFQIDSKVDLEECSWVERVNDNECVFYYEFESEPLFGSPTSYSGYLSKTDGYLLIGAGTGKARPVARKLTNNPTRLSISLAEQHNLISMNDGSTIIEAAHPKHRQKLVEDMTMNTNESRNTDQMRKSIREEKHPILKAHLRYDGKGYNNERVKVFLPEVQARIPPTVDAFVWVCELINNTIDDG